MHYEQAYTTTILYQDYAGNSLGSHDPIVNGNSTTLLADVADKVDQDAYDENQTELHKYLYKFHHWVDVSDSSKTYGFDENGVIPYTAPDGDVDRTVTLRAVPEDTSYQTDTYYRVIINNVYITYSISEKRNAINTIELMSEVNFTGKDVLETKSDASQGLDQSTYTYFVKSGGSIVIAIREGYDALLSRNDRTIDLTVDNKVVAYGALSGTIPYTLGVTTYHTVSAKVH